jgi:hypothetical protein
MPDEKWANHLPQTRAHSWWFSCGSREARTPPVQSRNTIPASSWEVGQMVSLAAKQQQAAVAPVSVRPL